MLAMVASVTVAIVVGAQVGWSVGRDAAASSVNRPVSACVQGAHVTVLASGKRCSHGVALTWNKAGRPGARGPQGLIGARGATGATGDQGQPGGNGPAGVLGSKLSNASGMSCNSHAGTITVQHDSATGLERFVCN